MRYLELTLPTPADNLACDEALLDLCEEADEEILRCWEPRDYFVVLGLATPYRQEVRLAACRRRRIPILRRISGGGAVLQGPGCLNFSLILRVDHRPALASITATNRFILERHRNTLEPLVGEAVSLQGSSDLTVRCLKFSGNAQRRRRRCVLFHGSFLLGFDIPLMEQVLRLPRRQPAYRHGRPHADFLTNLRVPSGMMKAALRQAWGTTGTLRRVPLDRIEALVTARYASDAWNYRF